jgi:hypothetical protein
LTVPDELFTEIEVGVTAEIVPVSGAPPKPPDRLDPVGPPLPPGPPAPPNWDMEAALDELLSERSMATPPPTRTTTTRPVAATFPFVPNDFVPNDEWLGVSPGSAGSSVTGSAGVVVIAGSFGLAVLMTLP